MQPLEAAQDLCRLAQRGGAPTPWQMRALQSPSLNQLSDSELADLGDFLAARLRSAGVRALVGEVTPAVVLAMVSAPEAVEDLLAQTHYRQQMVNAVVQAVAEGSALSLEVRSAFGVTTSQHAEVLRHAIRCRALTRADLLACVDNGVALTAKLLSPRASLPLRFETLLDAVGSGAQHPPDWGWNAEVHVNGTQGGFTVLVSNGYELWRAANFPTQEPETVAWLDETFHEGDCLYDIGANIGVYSLYALAKTHTAQAICFEPDAVNYYRLGMNMVANGFGARAVLFPVALSDHTGLATFNSSLFVAGKAENWLSPGEELFGPSVPPNPWQHDPRLRTGCPTFDLDSFLAQATFLPAPTHLKIDVDSVELAILRGAARTLQHANVRHVLVELYARELAPAQAMLAAAGFQYVRSVPQRNVLPCYEELLGNHLFARSAT